MTLQIDLGKDDIISKVITLVKTKLGDSKSELVSEFIRQFFGTVAVADLLEHSIEDLYGIALSFWGFMFNRQNKENKISVYNPDFESHGWQSTHTIIQVIQDDMP